MRLRHRVLAVSACAFALGIACISGDEASSSRGGATADGGPLVTGDDDTTTVPGDKDDGSTEPGPVDAGVDACATANLASDPHHCGACFRDCVHGACSEGVCQPWLLTTLAGNAKGVESDGKHLYFTTNGEVWRVQPDGGTLEQMTTLPGALAAEGLARGPNAMMVCGNNGGIDGGVYVVPTTPGGSAAFLHPVGSCVGLFAEGQTVWSTSASGIQEVNGISIARHGAGPFGSRPEGDIHVSGGQLFYTSQNTGLNRVATSKVDAGPTLVAPLKETRGIAVKDGVAYVSGQPTPVDGGGLLWRVPLDGGAPTVITSLPAIYYAQSVSVGPDGALYYAAGSNIYGFVPPR